MSTSNKPTVNWRRFRKQAHARADELEKTAQVTRLVAMADDPLDGLATLWDIAMLSGHATAVHNARRHGRKTPVAPVPVSRLLSGFSQQLQDKALAIAKELRSDETERLARIVPGFVAALEANEADVMLLIRKLLPHSPEVIALWLRAHLDVLEQRFAS